MTKYIRIKSTVALLGLAVFSFTKTYSQKYAEMAWQDSIRVDGLSNEWEFPLPLYDPKTKLNFQFSNDAHRMYFVFVANEDVARYKILTSGFSIQIDTAGGKKYNTEFLFEPDIVAYRTGASAYTRNVDTTNQRPNWSIPVKITGKGMRGVGEKAEIRITPNDKFGRMFCEVSIPFALFYKDSLKNVGNEKAFGIKVTLNKIPTKGNANMDPGGTGPSVAVGGYMGASGGMYGNGNMNAGGFPGGYPGGMYPNSDPASNTSGAGNNFPSSNTNNGVPANGSPDLTTNTHFVLRMQPRTPPIR